jgi:hypothetical protein
MPKLIGTRRPVGIPGRLLWVASIIVMMGTLPKTAGAQSPQRNDEPPFTDRERGLLERIQNLEKQLAQLRDVQVRLAAIEAKLGGSSTRPPAATPDPTPPQQSPPAAASGSQPAVQSSATTPTNADDKTQLPEASDGNPSIFGEFNPGR